MYDSSLMPHKIDDKAELDCSPGIQHVYVSFLLGALSSVDPYEGWIIIVTTIPLCASVVPTNLWGVV